MPPYGWRQPDQQTATERARAYVAAMLPATRATLRAHLTAQGAVCGSDTGMERCVFWQLVTPPCDWATRVTVTVRWPEDRTPLTPRDVETQASATQEQPTQLACIMF